ncbi:RHS repeat-associated core domain-containing protein [Alloprevotella tannerae]|uniref:RHS repeat-associated core domain-containing protein n=1 Tax=Alloprevotella tannerae TaxID=76122 RepID=UPI0028E368BA|nr:RHS repeat-associated core domain-containing protein [Alloprevotella tannerae]
MLREDGSGAIEYYYGKMGEVLKTVRTLIVPNHAVATYVTQWKYDSHNRLLEMIYPDEEKVTYGYNLGGQVDHVRGYKSYGYDYVNKIGYDKFEQRTYLKYCNGAETFYSYDPQRRRLQNLVVNAKAGTIMDNAYSYDAVSNVLGIKNNAPLPQSGKAGGQMSHSYTYDPLYRLASATGTYKGTDNKAASYTLSMGYDNMHRITSKKQHLSQTGVQFDGTLNAGYELVYTYGSAEGKKFQLDNVRDINYRTEETPTESTNINNGHKYTYDANGNLVYINTSRVKKDGKEDEKATEQKYKWDEENRLLAADENGFVSNYWYDADGERTMKTSGENEAIFVNSEFSGGNTGTARFSLYVSPYLVAGQGGKYTKHIYIGSQRIVSKLGDLASYGADPRRIPYAGNEADGLTINYKDKYAQQLQSIKDNYKAFDLPYNGKDNDDYVNGQGFCCNDGTPEAAQARAMARTRVANGNFHDKDNYEKMQFYYHSDHLGSSSYITNLDGEVAQHIEYVPFGEVFIEERNNSWNTPYLFNAKEFDEETGMYYYGARYYEPRLSLWMSTDPMEKNMPYSSTYTYCHNNPINRIDENGLADYFSTSGIFIRSDGNDKDPYIYIQTRKGNVILSDYNFGNYKSGGLRKMMRIVYHYAKKTGATQHATTIGVDASTPKGTDSNTLAYTLNDKIIRVLVKKGFFNKELSQIYNMSSTLSHESFHTQIPGKSREEEIQVIMRQMQAPEFKKTTASFKEGTAGYLQKELQKLYKENNRIFNKYIEKASELLKANGVNSVPTYLNGGNEIQF